MRMIRLPLLVALLSLWCVATLPAASLATFFPGSASGCFQQEGTAWKALGAGKTDCSQGMRIKTDDQGWGALEVTCGSLVIKSNTMIFVSPAGVVLERGAFRAFIRHAPGAFKFRLPNATMGIRGTIFTAQVPDGVSVEAGEVEVQPNSGSAVFVTAGDTWGAAPQPQGDAPIVSGALLFESALADEHDGRFEQAAQKFSALRTDPAFQGLPDFQAKLAVSLVENVSRAGLPAEHALVKAATEIARGNPNLFFTALENSLRQAAHGAAEALVSIGERIGKAITSDSRFAIAVEMNRLAQGGKPSGNKSVDTSGQTEKKPLPRFWQDSRVFLNILRNPEQIPQNKIVQLLQPESLALLSAKAKKERLAVMNKISPRILAAHGLYLLVRALLAAGERQDAESILTKAFREQFGDTPYYLKALKMFKASQPKTAVSKQQNDGDQAADDVAAPVAGESEPPRLPTSLDQAY